jgi:hypothetical protein
MTIGTIDLSERDQTKINFAIQQLAERQNAISAFGQSLLADPDAATFLATLGLSTFFKTLIGALDAATLRGLLGIADSGASTGDGKITLKTTADPGWIMCNDGTIGSATSGGSTRANADTQALFTLLFNNIDDIGAPLFTSAGAGTTRAVQTNAATAWANNSRVALTRQLGRSIAIAGAGAGLTARTLGRADGNETHTQTLSELVNHAHGSPIGGFQYILTDGNIGVANTGSIYYLLAAALATTGSAGSGGPMDIMNPRSYWNVMIKL